MDVCDKFIILYYFMCYIFSYNMYVPMFVNVSQNYQFLKVSKDYSIIIILYHYHQKKSI